MWAAAASLLALVVANSACYVLATRLGRFWPRYAIGFRPAGIVIHHSATPTTPSASRLVAAIEHTHATRGWGVFFGGRVYHIGYHYLIGPGGEIIPGRPEWLPGAHARNHNDMLGICLLGNFSRDPSGRLRHPTDRQLRALASLVASLLDRYDLSPHQVYLHRDIAQTECPGEGFPRDTFFRLLRVRRDP